MLRQAKSLKRYAEEYRPKVSIRTSMSDYRKEAWLVNIPLDDEIRRPLPISPIPEDDARNPLPDSSRTNNHSSSII